MERLLIIKNTRMAFTVRVLTNSTAPQAHYARGERTKVNPRISAYGVQSELGSDANVDVCSIKCKLLEYKNELLHKKGKEDDDTFIRRIGTIFPDELIRIHSNNRGRYRHSYNTINTYRSKYQKVLDETNAERQIRVSDHDGSLTRIKESAPNAVAVFGIVLKNLETTRDAFAKRERDDLNYIEYEYQTDKTDNERRCLIIDGIVDFIENGVYVDYANADEIWPDRLYTEGLGVLPFSASSNMLASYNIVKLLRDGYIRDGYLMRVLVKLQETICIKKKPLRKDEALEVLEVLRVLAYSRNRDRAFTKYISGLLSEIERRPSYLRDILELSFLLHKKNMIGEELAPNVILRLYEKVPNFAERTSTSKALQQFSTPLPLAFLVGWYAVGSEFETLPNGVSRSRAEKKKQRVYLEPTAGTGLLTIHPDIQNVYLNELDDLRRNLLIEGYPFRDDVKQVTDCDASCHNWLKGVPYKSVDGVIANPPFAQLDKRVYYTDPNDLSEWVITKLEHLIALRALDYMKDDGRAAIIIGGPMGKASDDVLWRGLFDDEFHFYKAHRPFFNYLYSHYNVEDVLNIDGKLYTRMGTNANVRMILINGRKAKPDKTMYQQDVNNILVYDTWEALWDRLGELIEGRPIMHYPTVIGEKSTEQKTSNKLNATAQLQLFKFKMAMAKAKEAERVRRELVAN